MRPQRLVLGLAVAALVLSAGAFAAVEELPWWQGAASPVDPRSVVAVARDNLPANVAVGEARTVARDGDAALVAVPLDKTGYCLVPSFAGRASLGAQCVYSVSDRTSGAGDITRAVTGPGRPGDAAVWLVYGRIAGRWRAIAAARALGCRRRRSSRSTRRSARS